MSAPPEGTFSEIPMDIEEAKVDDPPAAGVAEEDEDSDGSDFSFPDELDPNQLEVDPETDHNAIEFEEVPLDEPEEQKENEEPAS